MTSNEDVVAAELRVRVELIINGAWIFSKGEGRVDLPVQVKGWDSSAALWVSSGRAHDLAMQSFALDRERRQ